MLNRAFFSLQSNWIPTLVALGNLFVNVVLDLAFVPLGIWGIPLATSLVNIAGTATLLVLLRRRVGRIHFGEIAASSWRIVVAALVAGGAAFGVWYGLDDALGRGVLGQIVSLGRRPRRRRRASYVGALPRAARPRAGHAPLAQRALPPALIRGSRSRSPA